MNEYEFNAIIKKHESINAAFIEFPYDTEKEFGIKGQVKVHATIDGYEYRGSLAKMGHHCHCLGLTQKLRNAIGKNPGETVSITLKKDDVPRVIDIPEDFKKQLEGHAAAKEFFDSLSYTNQKEYVQWITTSKKSETRQKRIEGSIVLLLDKVKHP